MYCAQGMEELLEEGLQRCPSQRKSQLQYILQQLNQEMPSQQGEEPEDSGDEGQDDDDDEEVRMTTNLSNFIFFSFPCRLIQT